MYMKQLIIFFLTLLFLPLYSQNAFPKHDYNWIAGYPYSTRDSQINGVKFDFSNKIFKINSLKLDLYMYTYSGNYSDRSGNFLYYSNGCVIKNRNHQTVNNGDSINPGEMHNYICKYGYVCNQGSIFFEDLRDSNITYLVHQRNVFWDYASGSLSGYTGNLLYTKIDNLSSNGFGKALEKNVNILKDTMYTGSLTACKHANGRDWWIMQPRLFGKYYHRILFDTSGFKVVGTQEIGDTTGQNGACGSQACFSPNGTKYVRFSAIEGISIFDFDRQTGLLSNYKKIVRLLLPSAFVGVAVSPNSRFLYAFARNKIYQYDLRAADIEASEEIVAEYDGFLGPYPTRFYAAQLAPDCKIYFIPTSSSQYMHYIRYPDRKGLACEVVQHGVAYPNQVNNNGTIPYFPNYRLGVVPTHPCDSTISFRVSTKETLPPLSIILYPNPVGNELNIDYTPDNANGELEIKVFDILGKTVFNNKMDAFKDSLSINVSNLAEGMYIISVSVQGKKTYTQKIIKIRN